MNMHTVLRMDKHSVNTTKETEMCSYFSDFFLVFPFLT